jgi:DNA-directed RNA polymerase specialized sigma24 family protein
MTSQTIPKSPPAAIDGLTEQLYAESFVPVARLIAAMGGSIHEARDILHDALIIYYEKVADPNFALHMHRNHYITGIAKHLWLRRHTDDRRKISLDSAERAISIPPDFFPAARTTRLLDLLERSGKKCLELLRACYYGNDRMEKLANNLGYTTAHAASVQKHKCLDKIRTLVHKRSLNYEDFFE